MNEAEHTKKFGPLKNVTSHKPCMKKMKKKRYPGIVIEI